jgi:L-ascorbate metabolism protein UlaG (beta-lactamase superfamily)
MTKKILLNLILRLFIVLVFLAWFVGWFQSQQTWKRATGFDTLPVTDLPPIKDLLPTEIKIYWLGHAGFLINWHKQNILLDPNLSDNSLFVKRLIKKPLDASELPPIDFAIISHAHYDHLDLPTLAKIKKLKTLITPQGTADFLSPEVKSKSKLIGLKLGESYQSGPLEVISVLAIHKGSRNHPWASKYRASGYIIRDKERTIYFAGDTAYGTHFKYIKKNYAPDIALLPIGGFEPNFILKHYHLNPEEAVQAGLDLGSKIVMPIHFGTFRVALDYPALALPRFAKEARKRHLLWLMPELYSKKH